jgi:hypothetical protein
VLAHFAQVCFTYIMKRIKNKSTQPELRSHIARAAHMRNSAGAMGGGKRRRNRKDRAAARQALKGEA